MLELFPDDLNNSLMGSFLITMKHLTGYMLSGTLFISQNVKPSKKNEYTGIPANVKIRVHSTVLDLSHSSVFCTTFWLYWHHHYPLHPDNDLIWVKNKSSPS